ncbi:EAL domain-containing protein [Halomonas salinarum]|uniref:EAL domain-containing protein n=1 Tax=Halomonas salinarum TaxID=1158993 RepID=UPI00143A7B44|nr:EAL domain-containing protein [Halomonas salinarum]
MPVTAQRQSHEPTHDHCVQFYDDDAFLAEVIADHLLEGAQAGERLFVALTPAHLTMVKTRLEAQGMDVAEAERRGQLVVHDAHQLLAAIMRNGMPDRARFDALVLETLFPASAAAEAPVPVRAYGELVNLLCEDDQPDAAVYLEALWDEACRRLPLNLLCAYAMHHFQRPDDSHVFQAICHGHSHVLPAEDFRRLTSPHARQRQVSLLQQRANALDHEIRRRQQAEAHLDETNRRWQGLLLEITDQFAALTTTSAPEGPPGHEETLAQRHALQGALARGEVALYYRPLIDAASGQIVGVEASPHWQSPQFGVIAGAPLLALIEQTDQLPAIGQWVLEQACRQGQAWVEAGLEFRIAFNVSTNQLLHEDIVERIAAALSDTGLSGDRLEIEITERVLASDPVHAENILTRLKALGIRLTIDEFGSGQPLLRHLHRFPVDAVKLDGTLTEQCSDAPHQQAIIRALLLLARQLGLAVSAQGVATRAQAEFLRKEGCEILQGPLWAPLEYRGDQAVA